MPVENYDDILVISDFNADVLVGLFDNDDQTPLVNASSVGFGQVMASLLNDDLAVWKKITTAFVWTRPEGISETFRRAKLMELVEHEEALREVDTFCRAIITASSHVSTMVVATWHLPDDERGYGMLDLQQNFGIRSLVARMNIRLTEHLSRQKSIFVLDSTRWYACKGADNAKMWYLAKVPFSNDVFKAAIGDVKSALRGVKGYARKVVVCDLDDVLWGGIVGDVGWENLRLGGHDPVGEALVDFQLALKAAIHRGIILAIVSKNTESIALEAIVKHPEMVLRMEDFAGWRINWNDKAQNIVDLMKELNLGLHSAVFLDDNPVERARVRDVLPEVLVPELPKDKMLYPSMLSRLDCFDTPFLTEEDRRRSDIYSTERKRRAAIPQIGDINSLKDWVHTLKTSIQAEPINDRNRQRAVQLFNKTNQMNLTGRRMTERELIDWIGASHRKLWTFRVSDKFGDSGLTGIASVEFEGSLAVVTDYILSCRVMGRYVEEAIIYTLAKTAKALGAATMVANYRPTEKNKPSLDFWERSGFTKTGEYTFVWDLTQTYPKPEVIELTILEGDV